MLNKACSFSFFLHFIYPMEGNIYKKSGFLKLFRYPKNLYSKRIKEKRRKKTSLEKAENYVIIST